MHAGCLNHPVPGILLVRAEKAGASMGGLSASVGPSRRVGLELARWVSSRRTTCRVTASQPLAWSLRAGPWGLAAGRSGRGRQSESTKAEAGLGAGDIKGTAETRKAQDSELTQRQGEPQGPWSCKDEHQGSRTGPLALEGKAVAQKPPVLGRM